METPYLDKEIKTEKAWAKAYRVKESENKKLTEFKAIKEALNMPCVSKSVAIDYAKNCIKRNHNKMPLLEIDDYIKQYCG